MSSPIKRKRVNELQRYKERKKRKRDKTERERQAEKEAEREEQIREEIEQEAQGTENNNEVCMGVDEQNYTMKDVGVQTELTLDEISSMEVKFFSVSHAQETTLSEEFLKSDSNAVKFYTGLPSYARLKAVFDFVSASMDENPHFALPLFQQFFVTIMKLQLNLTDQDLAYCFGVNQSTISRNFRKWIDIMDTRLEPTIRWPSQEEVKKTMPMEFRKYFKQCICIIDCFEVFCERPSDLMARAQTFSNYKTIKFLIGITPQGVISFVSKVWGGRVSDKYLTKNCGLLSFLQPGDVILADRGFTVQDSVGLYCAEVKMPPFTRGKKQLSRSDVDKARQLSCVRIHVERVIGVIRQKYTILQSTLPINMIMCDEEQKLVL